MGSEWARQTNGELQAVYEISGKRADRIVSIARLLLHPPAEYEGVLGTSEKAHHERAAQIGSLVETLRTQSSDCPEAAWNNLMDELGCPARADAGVYLLPWEEIDASEYDPAESAIGVRQTRLK